MSASKAANWSRPPSTARRPRSTVPTPKQRQIETYLAVASKSDIESQPNLLDTAAELREAEQHNDRVQYIADIASRPERPETEPVRPAPYAAPSA